MKRSIVSLLLLVSSSVFPVTTYFDCLYNPETKQKIALLYDNCINSEPSEANSYIVEDQTKDLTELVHQLSTKSLPITFINDGGGYVVSPSTGPASSSYVSWVVPRLFLDQNVAKIGNVTLDLFQYSTMTELDMLLLHFLELIDAEGWATDNEVWDNDSKESIDLSLSQGPEHAHFTITAYLENIKTRCVALLEEINKLPACYTVIKQKLTQEIASLLSRMTEYIQRTSQEYNLKESDYIFWIMGVEFYKYSYCFEHQIRNLYHRENDVRLLCKALQNTSPCIVVECLGSSANILSHGLQQAGFRQVTSAPTCDHDDDSYSFQLEDSNQENDALFRRGDHPIENDFYDSSMCDDLTFAALDLELSKLIPAFFGDSL